MFFWFEQNANFLQIFKIKKTLDTFIWSTPSADRDVD